MIYYVNKKNNIIGYSYLTNVCDGQIVYDAKKDKFDILKYSTTDREDGFFGNKVQQWLWNLKDKLDEKPHLICTG